MLNPQWLKPSTALETSILGVLSSVNDAPGLGGGGWTPAQWFLASEQGIWLDPSDMSTMFQDSAGTTPVTAVEQPVGKILDKSGRGNHATQATAGSRPKLSARKNWLLATTTLSTQSVTLLAAPHTLSFTGTGTLTLTGASTAGPLVGTGVSDRVSLTFTPSAGSVTFTVSGSVTLAQLEYGSVAGTYQRVTTATDYDTVGFLHYLKFDGVDDSLSTGSIDFTATDKMTVVAGLTKLSEAAAGIACTVGVSINTTPGVEIAAGPNTNKSLAYGSRGTTLAYPVYTDASISVPKTMVLTGQSDISADICTLRVDGSQVMSSASDQGSGSYGSAAIHIGRRGGTAIPFNGNLYQLTVRGAATADLTPGETFAAGKTGVTL